MSASPGEMAYLEFRMAHSLYGTALGALTDAQRREVHRVAARQRDLEARVLGAPEAMGVCVPDATLGAALDEIRRRYGDDGEYLADLAANGLSQASLEAALRAELAVDAVLHKISADAPAVSEVDAELFYRLHIERFVQPERRRASHILITINECFAENARDAARQCIEAIAERLAKDPRRFAEQALKHSECPTALQGGVLGEYRRGQMFEAVDEALFALGEGGLSDVVESPLGFHILRCDAIVPAGPVAFLEVLPRIRATLADERARSIQRNWLRRLLHDGARPKAAAAPGLV